MKFTIWTPLMLLAALLWSATALAWEPLDTCGGTDTAWGNGSPNTTWKLSTTYTLPSSQLSSSQVDSAIGDAFDEWSQPGCTSFSASQGSDASGDPMGNSNNHLIGFYTSWPGHLGQSTLAVTLPSWYTNNCEIVNADMVVNADSTSWVNGNPGNWNQADLQSVIAHEAGHWIGFDHSNYTASTLQAYYSGGIDERTLTCDDTEGVCDLYTSNGNSCSADRYCECGVGCNNGSCGGSTNDDDTDTSEDGCSGPDESYSESEPNNWNNEDDVDWFESDGGDATVTGQLTCGNNGSGYTGDIDWIVIDFPCTDRVKFGLDWDGNNSDLDFYVWGSDGEDALVNSTTAESSGPLSETVANAGGRLYFAVACWEGNTTNYDLTIDWHPYNGSGNDDDDDDDDTSGNNDDTDTSGDTGAGGGGDGTRPPQDDDDDDDDDGGMCGCSAASPAALMVPSLLGMLLVGRRRKVSH